MTGSNEGLMKLIALTKQQREIGPLLQHYVQRKYGVENMAAFTKEEIEGVEDKEALYLQWVEWIEAGDLSHFQEGESQGEAKGGDAPAAEADPADEAAQPEEDAPAAAPESEAEDDEAGEGAGEAEPGTEAEAAAETEPAAEPEPAADAPATPADAPEERAPAGAVDALILSMIRKALAAQPRPEQSLTEDRVREIVQEELRRMVQSLLK